MLTSKKLLFALLLGVLPCFETYAQAWIDVTDSYIKNPRYDNNDYSFWEGTPLSGYNPHENAEHYEKTFNTYQVLKGLPAGKYRVSLNAFYRMGSSQEDFEKYYNGTYKQSQYAKLYAESSVNYYDVGIVPASSARLANSLGGETSLVGNTWNTYHIPNNMDAAFYWFTNGKYVNELECEVGADGVLTIGILKNEFVYQDWVCIDNWKLESYVEMTGLVLDQTSLSLISGETAQLNATITPSDLLVNSSAKWTSSNTEVATVENGLVTAVASGSAFIYAKMGTYTKSCRVTVSTSTPTSENIVINEIMAANVDVYRDPSTNFGCWVELYNPTNRGVALGGLYVTDDPANLKKHKLVDKYGTLPAHGFAILNFDHHENFTSLSYRQIDFKLNCDGGTIIVSDGTNIIAQQDYPQALSRVSYARTEDGGDTWANAGNPTPGETNAENSAFAKTRLEAPEVNKPGQRFTGILSVKVTIPEGATLRYTTDGTTPTLTNGTTSPSGSFAVKKTTCYRFRLFKDGYLPSAVVTRSYLFDSGNEPFPIISVVTDDSGSNGNIFNSSYALFQRSTYGRPGNGQNTACNWNMDWDRPVNFEYITTDNECVISQECDFSACGGWSRAWTPHSFKLKASKQYDLLNSFDYQFFDEKPFLKHKTLQIRNGGNDNGCRIKDPALQRVISSSGLYVDYQSWQPVHVFVNGEPYAVLNMREPNNKHHGYSNYGIDTDEMDQFEICADSGYVQMEGTNEVFLKWYDLAKTADDASSYAEIQKLVDIDEYINYMAVQLYLGGNDWPRNNLKAYRDRNDGKFRFILFDLDAAFSSGNPFNDFFAKEHYRFDNLLGYDYSRNVSIAGTSKSLELKVVTIFKNMLKNDSFRKQFIDAFCIVAGSVFEPNRVKEIVNEAASYLGQGNYVWPSNTANDIIRNLSASRQTSMITQLRNNSNMKLSSAAKTYKLSSNIDEASILVNGQEVPTGKFSGQLFAPAVVTAKAPAGYKFLGWMSGSGNTTTQTVFEKNSSWMYYDSGSLDNQKWTSASYSTSKWKSGNAPLGYNNSNSTTTKTAKNLPTYYFRKQFDLTNVQSSDVFTLDYNLDDGLVVYVNGTEAYRVNMPNGTINYNSLASTYADDNYATGTVTLPTSLFKSGSNVIAVEVHNNNTTSSDILWNASLTRTMKSTAGTAMYSEDPVLELPSAGATLTAMWEKEDDAKLYETCASPIKINEISAGNAIFVNEYFKKDDWVELYNTTDSDIDAAGLYISDNSKKPEKYQIPSGAVNTIIPAHGYLIIWCNTRDDVSQLHANFKLGNKVVSNPDDQLVMITAGEDFVANNKEFYSSHPDVSKEFTDVMKYGIHNYDQSVGRYPDGGNSYSLMNHPTIAKANYHAAADTVMGTDEMPIVGQITIRDILAIIDRYINGDRMVDITDITSLIERYLAQ
ncbi:MAG: CotH kinase family protein [Bacteroidaceae bacterium]|nr:CotH kinase family protein [Bacteroidaceae bacterium]